MTGPTIGVYAGVVGGYYFGVLLRGITQATKAAGGRVIAVQTLDAGSLCEGPDTPPFTQAVATAHVDAWITILGSASDEQLAAIHASGKPIVLVSDGWTGPVNSVVPDNRGGVRDAVTHLIEHCHRRIAFVGHVYQPDVQERYEGYCATLLAHGIEPDPALFYNAIDNYYDMGREAAGRFLADGMPATAIMCGTDGNALGVLDELRAAGVDVPGRVALVGFDNDELAAKAALSSVSQRFDAIGATAAGLALAALDGTGGPPRQHVVPTWFVARATCGCASAEPAEPEPTEPVSTAPDGVETVAGSATRRLCDVLAVPRDDLLGAEGLQRSVETVCAQLRRVVDGGEPDRVALAGACEGLQALMSREEDIRSVTSVLGGVGRELLHAGLHASVATEPERFSRLTAVEDVIRDIALRCMSLHVRNQRSSPEFFQDLLATQFEISLDLLRRREDRPQALAWLQRTQLTAGCFGMWAQSAAEGERSDSGGPAGQQALEIAGVFPDSDGLQQDGEGSGSWHRGILGERLELSQFPPRGFLALGDSSDDDVVIVLAVKVGASDWGWLAVVGPVETRITSGRQSTDQWAALLTVALDNETVLRSLHHERENLSRAYTRERGLVEGLRASEERYALALRAANDGLWDWDLASGAIYYSARWKEMLGYTADEIGTSPAAWLDRVHEADRPSLELALARHVSAEDGADHALEHEHRLRGKDGAYSWVLCRGLRVTDGTGATVRLVGSSTDITERKQLEARLRRDATYDSITLLPNRVLFLERLRAAVDAARSQPWRAFAVLYLDLDGFKVVNDSLGHLFGDKLLVAVSSRLQHNLRDGDIAARIGGDEFAVLLNDVVDRAVVTATAERLQAQLATPFDIEGHHVVVSAGIGIALSATGYDEPEDVLRDADIAMYRAKALGGGTHVTFDVDMHVRAMQRLSVEGDLRTAIDTGGFALHYQPIVALESGQVDAFEALIRWPHPERGLLMPLEFLDIAEDTGLAVGIGAWVLQEGCRQLSEWALQLPEGGAGPTSRLSLNVSNRQFWHKEFLPGIEGLLRTSAVAPESLCLEITEGVIMHNPGQADALLRSLHGLGIRLHLDDFGTGYSSLEALHRFEIDALKIDRSFVARLGVDDRSVKIVRTILLMGEDLDVDVIAEGVETELQAGILRGLGCTYAQGYLFSRPVPAPAALAMLQRNVLT